MGRGRGFYFLSFFFLTSRPLTPPYVMSSSFYTTLFDLVDRGRRVLSRYPVPSSCSFVWFFLHVWNGLIFLASSAVAKARGAEMALLRFLIRCKRRTNKKRLVLFISLTNVSMEKAWRSVVYILRRKWAWDCGSLGFMTWFGLFGGTNHGLAEWQRKRTDPGTCYCPPRLGRNPVFVVLWRGNKVTE